MLRRAVIRLTIQRKVFLGSMALAAALAGLLILLAQRNLEQGFGRYIAETELQRLDWLVRNIEAGYAEHGNWDFLRGNREAWLQLQDPRARGVPLGGPVDAVRKLAHASAPNRAGAVPGAWSRLLGSAAWAQERPPDGPPPRPGFGPPPGQRNDFGPPGGPRGERPPPFGMPAPGAPPGSPGAGAPGPGTRPGGLIAPGPAPAGVPLPAGGAAAAPAAPEVAKDSAAARGEPAAGGVTAATGQASSDDNLEKLRGPGPAEPAASAAAPALPAPAQGAASRPSEGPGEGPPPDLLGILGRLTLLDAAGAMVAGNPEGYANAAPRQVRYQGEPVGTLLLQAPRTPGSTLGQVFLAGQTRNLLLAGAAALALAFLAAWLLARHLLAPIRDLAAGARSVAGGRLIAHIPVRSEDELGELTADFNAMAARLAGAERTRRQWIADASHELRTPIAVLRAEIEAIQDGVHAADDKTLNRLLRQVAQLAKLVDDLRATLDGDPGAIQVGSEPMAPIEVLHEVIEEFRERYATAGLAIDTSHLLDGGWRMPGDADRMHQVFINLLENTLRYTHAGGSLAISAEARAGWLTLQFDDTAPAPRAEALPRLFDRFFRAEPSRSRALGGSGLGLAICKALVEAHGGKIAAALSPRGGLTINIRLPLERA